MTYGVVAVGHTAAASATTSLAHAYSEKLERKERKKDKADEKERKRKHQTVTELDCIGTRVG